MIDRGRDACSAIVFNSKLAAVQAIRRELFLLGFQREDRDVREKVLGEAGMPRRAASDRLGRGLKLHLDIDPAPRRFGEAVGAFRCDRLR